MDTYTKLRDHCMKMEVEIKTKVEHPEQNGAVHDHKSPKVNFGCSEPWFGEGDDGTKIPIYLEPAAIGILIQKSQTTSGMGVHPNDDGNKCISNLIFEADTLEPGVTPLKWKLSIPQAPNTSTASDGGNRNRRADFHPAGAGPIDDRARGTLRHPVRSPAIHATDSASTICSSSAISGETLAPSACARFSSSIASRTFALAASVSPPASFSSAPLLAEP